jgi:cytoskeletal protein CcmA (bactofilin family)
MWRKSTEAKPSSRVSAVPAPVSIQPQEAPQVPLQTRSSAAVLSAPAAHAVVEPSTSGFSKIGSGLKIRGEFSGNSDLYIDGDAQGKIRLDGARVTVGPNGRVQADIEAREIVVEGTVQGNLKASERVRLGVSSRVQGTVLAPRIAIDDGAQFCGKVEMTRASASSASSAAELSADADALRPVSAHAVSE